MRPQINQKSICVVEESESTPDNFCTVQHIEICKFKQIFEHFLGYLVAKGDLFNLAYKVNAQQGRLSKGEIQDVDLKNRGPAVAPGSGAEAMCGCANV